MMLSKVVSKTFTTSHRPVRALAGPRSSPAWSSSRRAVLLQAQGDDSSSVSTQAGLSWWLGGLLRDKSRCTLHHSKPFQLAAPCFLAALVCLQGSSTTQQQQQQPGPPPSEEDLPVWVRREKERELQAAGKGELPWPLYLVASVLVAIASVSVYAPPWTGCCCACSALCAPFKPHACVIASLPPLLHKLTADLCCAAGNRLGLCLSTLTATLCLASSHQTAHCGRQCWGCLPSLASQWQVGRWVWVGGWGPNCLLSCCQLQASNSSLQHVLCLPPSPLLLPCCCRCTSTCVSVCLLSSPPQASCFSRV